jgi:hypothetical protein
MNRSIKASWDCVLLSTSRHTRAAAACRGFSIMCEEGCPYHMPSSRDAFCGASSWLEDPWLPAWVLSSCRGDAPLQWTGCRRATEWARGFGGIEEHPPPPPTPHPGRGAPRGAHPSLRSSLGRGPRRAPLLSERTTKEKPGYEDPTGVNENKTKTR